MKDKIRCIPNSEIINNHDANQYFEAINLLIESNITNKKTGKLFDLSHVDRKFASCAFSFGLRISTGDGDIKDLANQEFPKTFKGSLSPLGMINMWIRNGLIDWNDTLNEYVADWKRNEEDSQPKRQKSEYKKLTGLRYPGS